MTKKMKRFVLVIFSAAALVPALSTAVLADPAETFLKGCEKEIKTYCSEVTPGEGRLIACIYAHEDKISGKCEYAVYDAAVQLERAVAALSYVASSCDKDIDTFCADVPVGEGRVEECLSSNKDKVSEDCREALRQVGM